MLSNTDSTNKKYTLGTKIKLFLKWAGVVVFGILSIACFLATLVMAINFLFLLFGYPLNVLIPFLQFLAPVLTSYLWTLLGPIIPLAICAVFAFITYKIYKLKIKEEFVQVIPFKQEKTEDKKENNNINNKNEIKKEENIDNSEIKEKENININEEEKKEGNNDLFSKKNYYVKPIEQNNLFPGCLNSNSAHLLDKNVNEQSVKENQNKGEMNLEEVGKKPNNAFDFDSNNNNKIEINKGKEHKQENQLFESNKKDNGGLFSGERTWEEMQEKASKDPKSIFYKSKTDNIKKEKEDDININENDKDKKPGVYEGKGGMAKGKNYQKVYIPKNVEEKLKNREEVDHSRKEKENDFHDEINNQKSIALTPKKKIKTIQYVILRKKRINNPPEMDTDQAKKNKE